MTFIGIDPGVSGGLAILRDGSETCVPLPYTGGEVDIPEMMALVIAERDVRRVFVEEQSIRSAQGGQVKLMREYGRILGALAYAEIPHEIVRPQLWKPKFGLSKRSKTETAKETKARSVAKANQMFGKTLKDSQDGMAEALLIAEFGRRRMIVLPEFAEDPHNCDPADRGAA